MPVSSSEIEELAPSQSFGDEQQHGGRASGRQVHRTEVLLTAEETTTHRVPLHEGERLGNSAAEQTFTRQHHSLLTRSEKAHTTV